tara:strand:+ start:130 stop:654 length:525 start_codon:yes stop_codon:yes gene_type:complete
MFLSCNSCGKKFVVPDQAISENGRLVQCGSCGNKWKQFPSKNEMQQKQSISSSPKKVSKPRQIQQKIQKPKKAKKKSVRKQREINLYSPEYLAKKHGIKLNEDVKKISPSNKVSFGFYNSFLLFLLIIIILSRGLYFFQDFVVQKLPFTEFYIDYFFESIKNMFDIWKNLISNY